MRNEYLFKSQRLPQKSPIQDNMMNPLSIRSQGRGHTAIYLKGYCMDGCEKLSTWTKTETQHNTHGGNSKSKTPLTSPVVADFTFSNLSWFETRALIVGTK
jgi:hypothetical protein